MPSKVGQRKILKKQSCYSELKIDEVVFSPTEHNLLDSAKRPGYYLLNEITVP